jgi:hypothetical protein
MLKRGDIFYTNKGERVKILGPEDFEGYAYNDPSRYAGKWALIRHLDHDTMDVWIPTKTLTKEKPDNDAK